MDDWNRVRSTFIVRDINDFGERVRKIYSSCR